MNRVEKARRAAGMTQQQAAAALGVSHPTYMKKEQNPRLMTFGELEMLGRDMDGVSRSLLWDALSEVERTARDDRHIGDVTLGEYCGLKQNPRLARELDEMRGKIFAQMV